jgi:hypothetical protein
MSEHPLLHATVDHMPPEGELLNEQQREFWLRIFRTNIDAAYPPRLEMAAILRPQCPHYWGQIENRCQLDEHHDGDHRFFKGKTAS